MVDPLVLTLKEKFIRQASACANLIQMKARTRGHNFSAKTFIETSVETIRLGDRNIYVINPCY